LVRDDRLVFQLPAAATLSDLIRDLYGASLLERLIEISGNALSKIQTSGFIGQAGISRQTRAQQLFFVKGRAIESGLITAAVREGYHTALMKGQYPVTFLFLTLDSGAVDVNVHPAKREVRFRDPTAVRDAIVLSVRQTLERGRIQWQEKFRAPASSSLAEIKIPTPAMAQPQLETAVGPKNFRRAYSPSEFAPPARFVPKDRKESAAGGVDPGTTRRTATVPQQFQIIGVLNKLYVLMENEDGLVLVDQHAAHERILFEELRRRMEEQGVPAQRLLLPQTIDLPPRDADWIDRNMSILQKMGIGIESFGPNTFKIDSLPSFLNVSDPTQFMRKVIDDLKSASNSSSAMRLGEEMIAKTVCRHAVKANDPLRYLEVEKLIQDLLECDLPYCCPHGRPTMIQISLAELEKKFGRKV